MNSWIVSWGNYQASCGICTPDFFLLIVRYEKKLIDSGRNCWAKRNQNLIIWRILILFQKMVMACSGKNSRVWLGKLLLEWLGMWLRDQINHFSRSQAQRWGYKKTSKENLLFLMTWIILTYRETRKVFKHVITIEIFQLRQKGIESGPNEWKLLELQKFYRQEMDWWSYSATNTYYPSRKRMPS